HAISAPGSDGSRLTGAIIAFVPMQKANDMKGMEDGYGLLLTDESWQEIRHALATGANLSVPSAAPSAPSISIEWRVGLSYTSAATGETYHAEKWNTYEPEGNPQLEPESGPVQSVRIVLLTSENELAARTTAEDLGDYANRIKAELNALFTANREKE